MGTKWRRLNDILGFVVTFSQCVLLLSLKSIRQRMISLKHQQHWDEIWSTVWSCPPLSHRMPCFQRDFGRRTRPLNLPRAPSTESACSPTWRSKRWSTRTEKTSFHLQGRRKVPSLLVLALGNGLPGCRHPLLLAFCGICWDTRSEGSYSAGWGSGLRCRAAAAEDEGVVYLLLVCASLLWSRSGSSMACWGVQEHRSTSPAKGSASSSLASQCLWVHSSADQGALASPTGTVPC